MHIVEVDEHLDYPAFYRFPPSTTNITEAAGNRTWELLHGLADNYPCPPCKPVFQTLMSGSHDLVNIHLGKPVHSPKRWKDFTSMVHEAERKVGSHGHHHGVRGDSHAHHY